jgi:DNA-binding transcriptional LysR family regulator
MTAFAAVVDHKGFAPAARRLGLSSASVTRIVAALEERLGIRLLQRTTRTVTLTDAGARYLKRVRSILADLDEAERSAQAERARPVGRFVLSAPVVFGRLHVSPLMCAYLLRHREVVGELLLADRIVNLVEEGVDLAVRIGHLPDSSLVVHRFGDTRRVVVASPGYLDKRGVPDDPLELVGHDVIHFSSIGAAAEWRFQRGGREERIAVIPHYVTNSADVAIWHAEHQGGVTMVLAYQVAAAVRANRLRIVLTEFEQPRLPIQFVYPASRLLSAKVRSFIDLAEDTCDWRFSEL